MIWDDEKMEYRYFQPGAKVKHKETGEIFTISRYEANICGDGCCDAYLVEENNFAYWPDSLEEIV